MSVLNKGTSEKNKTQDDGTGSQSADLLKEFRDLKKKFNDSDRKPEGYEGAPRITNEIAKMEEKKKLGDRTFQYVKNWWWWQDHKSEDYGFDIFFVTFPYKFHEAWNFNKNRCGKRDPILRTLVTKTNAEDKKIILGKKLKAALMTKA